MSDIKESKELGVAKMEEKLFEFKLNLKRMARRRAEVQYELEKIAENEAATNKLIAEIEVNLKQIGA